MLFAAFILGILIFWITLHLFRSNIIYWGSSEEERRMTLPKAERFKDIRIMDTHAVSISAPPDRIWPYLVQLGQNRGGFYSYRWLENIAGCRMPDADRILPQFQTLAVGDKVFLHPKAPPLTVSVLEPNRVLALEGWYLALVPKSAVETRLVTRSYDWRDPLRKSKLADLILSGVFFDFAHFIMERKMLLTIKKLVETSERKSIGLIKVL